MIYICYILALSVKSKYRKGHYGIECRILLEIFTERKPVKVLSDPWQLHHCLAIGRQNVSPLFIFLNSQLRRTNSFCQNPEIFFAGNMQRTILYIKAYFIFAVLFLRQNIPLRRRFRFKLLRQNKLCFSCRSGPISLATWGTSLTMILWSSQLMIPFSPHLRCSSPLQFYSTIVSFLNSFIRFPVKVHSWLLFSNLFIYYFKTTVEDFLVQTIT